jgi:rubredoxin
MISKFKCADCEWTYETENKPTEVFWLVCQNEKCGTRTWFCTVCGLGLKYCDKDQNLDPERSKWAILHPKPCKMKQ